MREWISVESKLVPDEPVIVFIPTSGGHYINIAYVDLFGDLYDVDENFIGYHADDVTHWMPLPEAPK